MRDYITEVLVPTELRVLPDPFQEIQEIKEALDHVGIEKSQEVIINKKETKRRNLIGME